tara:strand:- start:2942 stop:3616 length:675 start_codon:yes stop_codon:yes gene_type:complete
MNRILIVAAHPDDEILGCGGLMSKLSGEAEFSVLFLAEGTSCRFETPELDSCGEEIQCRNECAVRALRVLGVNRVQFSNLPCGKLDTYPLISLNKIIEKEIYSFKPDTIFTHYEHDNNADHRRVYKSTMIASRPHATVVRNVLSYEVLSSTECNFSTSFVPNYFVSLEKKDLDKKCLAMSQYSSECRKWPHPRSERGIRTLCDFRGMQSGFENCEAFKVIRMSA